MTYASAEAAAQALAADDLNLVLNPGAAGTRRVHGEHDQSIAQPALPGPRPGFCRAGRRHTARRPRLHAGSGAIGQTDRERGGPALVHCVARACLAQSRGHASLRGHGCNVAVGAGSRDAQRLPDIHGSASHSRVNPVRDSSGRMAARFPRCACWRQAPMSNAATAATYIEEQAASAGGPVHQTDRGARRAGLRCPQQRRLRRRGDWLAGR